jgi:hypothetical protein
MYTCDRSSYNDVFLFSLHNFGCDVTFWVKWTTAGFTSCLVQFRCKSDEFHVVVLTAAILLLEPFSLRVEQRDVKCCPTSNKLSYFHSRMLMTALISLSFYFVAKDKTYCRQCLTVSQNDVPIVLSNRHFIPILWRRHLTYLNASYRLWLEIAMADFKKPLYVAVCLAAAGV